MRSKASLNPNDLGPLPVSILQRHEMVQECTIILSVFLGSLHPLPQAFWVHWSMFLRRVRRQGSLKSTL